MKLGIEHWAEIGVFEKRLITQEKLEFFFF